MAETIKTIKKSEPRQIKIAAMNALQMEEAGLNFGHNISKLHPKMKQYTAGIKNNIHMIDMEKTAKEFEAALKYIAKIVSEKKTILFVGTKIQMKEIAKTAAEAAGMPYVTERWLGGTFTNFETILKRVQYFKDLESKKAHGEFEKYTKKERMGLDKEIALLKNKFEGIRNLNVLPEAVLILDVKKDIACAREARIKKIKIVGVVDTNIDPTLVDYMIPANDDAISSVRYILEKIKETIVDAKS